MYYFYIIQSLKNKKLYIGQTADLKKRLNEHNSGKNLSTKPYIPYEVIFYSGFKNKVDCISCEKYFKTTAGWKRIKKMLQNTLEKESYFIPTA